MMAVNAVCRFVVVNYSLGDLLVADNASIHFAADIAEELGELLDRAEVRLVFTPTYSPECNPCEFVFAQVKRFLRSKPDISSFLPSVYEAFASVSYSNVRNYYDSCISRRCN